jgi:hypothetical protein
MELKFELRLPCRAAAQIKYGFAPIAVYVPGKPMQLIQIKITGKLEPLCANAVILMPVFN